MDLKVQRLRRVGVESLLESDIPALAAASPDGSFATADLYNSIESGTYPEWQLWMQTMAPAVADALDFDPLDATKARPRPCGLPCGPASRACPRMPPGCASGPCSGSHFCRLRQPGPLGCATACEGTLRPTAPNPVEPNRVMVNGMHACGKAPLQVRTAPAVPELL